MPTLNVNTDAAVEHARRLTKISRSALPVAVRQTLNSVAFRTKKVDLLKSAKINFVERDPRFFKAFSRVDQAKGFNVNQMHATVGMLRTNRDATQNLSAQEFGGSVDRSLVPLDTARTGKNNSKKVAAKNRLGRLGNIQKGGGAITTKKGIAAAARRAGKGGLIVTGVVKRRVFRVKSVNDKTFKLEGLFTFVAGRKVRIKPAGFMRKAAQSASRNLENNFIKFAKLQINKVR